MMVPCEGQIRNIKTLFLWPAELVSWRDYNGLFHAVSMKKKISQQSQEGFRKVTFAASYN